MRKVYAYAFRSDLSLHDMLARLRELGPWRWTERDNDRWGEHISARALPAPNGGTVKIIEESDHFVVNVVLESDQPDAQARFDSVREILFDSLLPALGATGLARTETYE